MAASDMDISQLSETQQLALQQYTSVTAQDVQEAIPLLQRSQWNVQVCRAVLSKVRLLLISTQIAIAKFFDGEGPDPVAEAIAAQNIPQPRAARQENLQHSLLHGTRSHRSQRLDAAPRIVPHPDDDVVRRPPFILALLFTPFSLLYKIFASSFSLFSFLFPFLPRLLRPSPTTGTTRRGDTGGRRSLKPRDAAARLKREFEEEYGESTLPFHEGGYAQALDLAKKDLKFLLIILLSPEHDDTSSFIKETLLSPEVQSYINDSKNNIILWTGDIRDSEAYQVSTALVCNKFPFTAVVAHTPRVSSTAMSVIARVTGPTDVSTYLAKIRSAVSTHEEQLTTVRAARSAQDFERSLREQQDSAYERSLAADRERARQRKEG
jgi:FAS-associated factor 2